MESNMFAVAEALFEEYNAVIDAQKPPDAPHVSVLSEVRTKLLQLDYLVTHIRELESRPLGRFEANRLSMLVLLYTESFYYMAARLGTLVEDTASFGLVGRELCKTITRIRNQIIEHPEYEKTGRPLVSWSWRHDDGRGPVLEGRSITGEILHDPGLFRNADELRRRLEETIRAATQAAREGR
jgi:hypothetical protein